MDWGDFWDSCGAVIIGMVIGVVILGSAAWFAAKQQRIVINRAFKTNYTTSNIFWAGETIREIVQGKKIRAEITQKGGTK